MSRPVSIWEASPEDCSHPRSGLTWAYGPDEDGPTLEMTCYTCACKRSVRWSRGGASDVQ